MLTIGFGTVEKTDVFYQKPVDLRLSRINSLRRM